MSSALRTRRYAGSSPAGKANHHQRVGEPGRPHLPWKQGIGGSNPPTLTIIARGPIGQATDSVQTGSAPVRAANLALWRNRNAAVCKTAMSRGRPVGASRHALVDQPDGQPCSKRPRAGSSPVERAITTRTGDLAERQGNAVLTSNPSGCTGSIPVLSANPSLRWLIPAGVA